MNKREEKIYNLIDKAIEQKQNNSINYDYWESILFKLTDSKEMTMPEAYAIDKILGLNLY